MTGLAASMTNQETAAVLIAACHNERCRRGGAVDDQHCHGEREWPLPVARFSPQGIEFVGGDAALCCPDCGERGVFLCLLSEHVHLAQWHTSGRCRPSASAAARRRS